MMHGFFTIMGGFHVFERNSKEMSNNRSISREDDKPLHPLEEKDLRECNGYSESFITLTKVEIKDKGKSDWLAKFLVLLQTSWYMMQCFTRAREHLFISDLSKSSLSPFPFGIDAAQGP